MLYMTKGTIFSTLNNFFLHHFCQAAISIKINNFLFVSVALIWLGYTWKRDNFIENYILYSRFKLKTYFLSTTMKN